MNEFIKDICDYLNIEMPRIVFDSSFFVTDSMLAMFHNDTMYLKTDKPSPDLLFSIAHELRHKWQQETDSEKFFSDYKSANEVDIETYNLQLAEIDANAFATVVMADAFGIKPLYNGLPKKVVDEIEKYCEKI